MSIIGENTSTKRLQCIKYDNSQRKSLMWKNVVSYLFYPKIGPFSKLSTDLHINAIMMGISQKSFWRLHSALNVLHINITHSSCDILCQNQTFFIPN